MVLDATTCLIPINYVSTIWCFQKTLISLNDVIYELTMTEERIPIKWKVYSIPVLVLKFEIAHVYIVLFSNSEDAEPTAVLVIPPCFRRELRVTSRRSHSWKGKSPTSRYLKRYKSTSVTNTMAIAYFESIDRYTYRRTSV